MQRRSLPSLLTTVRAAARDYVQHLVWEIARESAREDVSETAPLPAKSNAPVLAAKDAPAPALEFAQADAVVPAEMIAP